MPRSKYAVPSRHRRNKILRRARGYWGAKSRLIKTAKESVDRSLQYAYRDRRVKKREFRNLWIARINAAVRIHNMSYSRFIHLLEENQISLNRKVLADLAVTDPAAFGKLVQTVSKTS